MRFSTFGALAVIGLSVSPVVHGAIIHESAILGPTGQTYPHWSIDWCQYLGSRFQVDSTVTIESVGGHLVGTVDDPEFDDSIFAAIVSLSSPTPLPSGHPFDLTTVATTVFDPPFPSEEVLIPLTATLDPGVYALIFGANQFGASVAGGGMHNNNADIPGSASYFQWFIGPEGIWRDISLSGFRFVVTGRVIPDPATWVLAGVAAAFLAVCMRRSHGMPRTVVAALALLVLGTTSSVQAEILDGQAVLTEYSIHFARPGTGGTISLYSVVGPGTEIMDATSIPINVDFSDTSIVITSRFDISSIRANDMGVTFWDAYGTIPRFTSVTVNPATTWPGFTPGPLTTFGANYIHATLLTSGGPTALEGDQISLDLTAMIPEPATWLFVVVAVSPIQVRRRRHSQAVKLSQ